MAWLRGGGKVSNIDWMGKQGEVGANWAGGRQGKGEGEGGAPRNNFEWTAWVERGRMRGGGVYGGSGAIG